MPKMCGVFAELERAITIERIKSGMARAKAKGTRSGRPIGRPKVSADVENPILVAAKRGLGKLKIARELGCGVSTVQRVLATTR